MQPINITWVKNMFSKQQTSLGIIIAIISFYF